MPAQLSVLIAEDGPSDRMLLSSIVSRQGYRVLSACNGLEAVAMFEQERPDLVLMDALMPVMDGFEAARRIKASAGETLVPIIFLTSLSEGEALVRCLEAGGDDFIAKPYNPVIIGAKITAMARLQQLQNTVLKQRDVIAQHNAQLLHDQRVAKAVFDRVAHAGCLNANNVRYLQSPLALFNGDLLLASHTPVGDMLVMLGDFTGHGLPAAIGAMPVAELFYAMGAKGYGLAEIARAINARLKAVLPVGVFCCATLACLSSRRGEVQVWAGGLPNGYLLGPDSHYVLRSEHLPLGVADEQRFSDQIQVYPYAEGSRLVLLSDGLPEAVNRHGEMFGEARLRQLFEQCVPTVDLCTQVQQALNRFCGGPQDDISLLEVSFTQIEAPLASEFSVAAVDLPKDCSVRFEWRAASLRHLNPVPQLMQVLLEVQGLRPRAGALYVVLAELYNNALEHGVLALDSSLKRDAAGFAEYYHERECRLAALDDGWLCIDLALQPVGTGGRLQITVEDSGTGVAGKALSEMTSLTLCGRGLRLVSELSDAMQWRADGRAVSVEFFW